MLNLLINNTQKKKRKWSCISHKTWDTSDERKKLNPMAKQESLKSSWIPWLFNWLPAAGHLDASGKQSYCLHSRSLHSAKIMLLPGLLTAFCAHTQRLQPNTCSSHFQQLTTLVQGTFWTTHKAWHRSFDLSFTIWVSPPNKNIPIL